MPQFEMPRYLFPVKEEYSLNAINLKTKFPRSRHFLNQIYWRTSRRNLEKSGAWSENLDRRLFPSKWRHLPKIGLACLINEI